MSSASVRHSYYLPTDPISWAADGDRMHSQLEIYSPYKPLVPERVEEDEQDLSHVSRAQLLHHTKPGLARGEHHEEGNRGRIPGTPENHPVPILQGEW